MPEKRLIDAYDLAEIIENMKITVAGKPARWGDAKVSVLREIAQAPDIDAVEVVRCKECEYSGKTSDDEEYYCQNKHGLNGYICDVSFCSNGKRKEGVKSDL